MLMRCNKGTIRIVVLALLLCGAAVSSLAQKSALSSPMIPSGVQHPLKPQIDGFLASQKAVEPTGLTRVDYLKIVDAQVGALRKYQKPAGDIPDPVDGRNQYSPPNYAHAVATLAASGFDTDPQLLESGMRAMDFSVDCLARGAQAFPDVAKTPDFYIYPVMLAFEEFAKVAPRARWETWRAKLATIQPASTYLTYNSTHNNWTLVHVGGEFLRSLQGMTDLAYVQHALQIQRFHMTPLGMYLEDGAPFAYDVFSRYYLAGMLERGYRDEFYRDACWKGAWTSLLIQSPFGELPTGYRSAQHMWDEAQLATLFEIYATEYARAGRKAEAGAFKRGAHLALESIKPWIRPDGSGYIVKNRFPMEARFGYEEYSVHVNYNLHACSMLCAAWQYADDSISERAAPADVGGFVIPIPDFHMVIAHAGGSYVQYMTQGNEKYNPTGLIRVHLRGGHPQLGYSDGILPDGDLPETPATPGRVEVLEESAPEVRFRVAFDGGRVETLTLNQEGVTVNAQSEARISFPMLMFDGQQQTDVKLRGNRISLRSGGRGINVEMLEPKGAEWKRMGYCVNHRNGKVEEAYADVPGSRVVYRISTNQP
jgi:hypothetical protein